MVRDRRTKRRVHSLFSLSLLVLSTNCCAYAKDAAAPTETGLSAGLSVILIIGFVAIGALLVFLDSDRRKKLEQTFNSEIDTLRKQLAEQTALAQKLPLLETMQADIERKQQAWLLEVDAKLIAKSKELNESINLVDSTLSKQVQEITGSFSKQVKQATDSMTKQSQDVTESISKEVAESSEGKFQNLRTEYKSALKAMAKVVDQQMTALQKTLSDSHRQSLDLLCATQFIELLEDPSNRIDASIELIRKNSSEEKIIALAQRFPSASAINLLRLLSGKQLSPDLADKLINSSLTSVDDLLAQDKIDQAAAVSVQIVEAGQQLGLPAATLLPIVRRAAEMCKTTRNVKTTEQLHELFVKLCSDGTGAVQAADVEEMLEMYKLVYPVDKAEDMHRRINDCMQAFGQELNTEALNNLAELAGVLTAQGKFEEAKVVLVDITTGLKHAESSVDDAMPASLHTAVKHFIASGRLEEAADIDWRLFDVHKSKNTQTAAQLVLKELHDITKEYVAKSDYVTAAEIERRRREGLVEIGATNDQQIEALNDLIEIYLKAERWESLATLMQDMIDLYRKIHGEHSEETIERISFAADVLTKVKQYDHAAALVESGLVGAGKLWGESSDKTLSVMNVLADLYLKLSRYADAEGLYRRILEHQEKSSDARLAKTYTNLGDTLGLQKDYDSAEQYFKQALDTLETNSGSDHPDILSPLSQLAVLYMTAGKYKDAEPCYKRILEIKYKVHGENSPEIIETLVDLGELYEVQSNFAEAEVFLETALETAQSAYMHDDNRLADVMLKYAKVLSQIGKEDEAIAVTNRATKIKAGTMHEVALPEAELPSDPQVVQPTEAQAEPVAESPDEPQSEPLAEPQIEAAQA